MLAAESSQRGFVITGNEIYLAPYQSAKAQAQRHLAVLERLLPSDFELEFTLKRLSTILATKFEEFDRTIALKRTQGDEANTVHLSHEQRQGAHRRSQCVFRRHHRKGRRSFDVRRRRAACQHDMASGRLGDRCPCHCGRHQWRGLCHNALHERASRHARSGQRAQRRARAAGCEAYEDSAKARDRGKCCSPKSITGWPTAWPSSRLW